jgi:branched-chain amino acid aminotransferase
MPSHRDFRSWLDGKLVDYDESRLHPAAYSLHYGLAVFEGIRSYEGSSGRYVFRLAEHIARLFDSCHVCGIGIPFSQAQLVDACVACLRENQLGDAYLRPIVYIGDGTLAVGATDNPVHVYVATRAWLGFYSPEAFEQGMRVRISSYTRNHVNAAMAKAKIAGQYVNSVLAKREAQAAGCADAILLDHQGMVTEASAENVFIVKRGRLKTPPLSSAILAGITRDTIIRLAKERSLEVEESGFARDEVYCADEMFLCGTGAEVAPVVEVDGRRIGDGKVGPVTRLMRDGYSSVVRGAAGHEEWLLPY